MPVLECPRRKNVNGKYASCELVILETGIDEKQHETACAFCIKTYPLEERVGGRPVLTACWRATKNPKYLPDPPKVLRPQDCIHLGAFINRENRDCQRCQPRQCNCLKLTIRQDRECETCDKYEAI